MNGRHAGDPAHIAVKEETGCLEQAQVMPLGLTLTLQLVLAGLDSCLLEPCEAWQCTTAYHASQDAFSGPEAKLLLLFTENLFAIWEAFLLEKFQMQQPILHCSSITLVQVMVGQLEASFCLRSNKYQREFYEIHQQMLQSKHMLGQLTVTLKAGLPCDFSRDFLKTRGAVWSLAFISRLTSGMGEKKTTQENLNKTNQD